MKIRKALILPIIASMLLGVVMIGPVGAPSTTIGVEPQSTVDLALVPGSTFSVEIWVRGVTTPCVGIEFKLGYDTTVLTATTITYGGVFDPVYIPLISVIYDADGYLHYSIMDGFGDPGFTGDGRAAIITFTVDSVGASALDLYGTKLGDTSLPLPRPIPHSALDGYFRNAPVEVTLARRKAWPEHVAYGTEEDEDSYNDLFALVSNDGVVDTWVKVIFTVTDSVGVPQGDFETATIQLSAGAMYGETKYNRYKATPFPVTELGKFYVTAQCWTDTDGDTVPDTAMGLVKTFHFAVTLTTH